MDPRMKKDRQGKASNKGRKTGGRSRQKKKRRNKTSIFISFVLFIIFLL